MNSFLQRSFFFAITLASISSALSAGFKADSQIRKELIDQSIAAYPESCPCPYSSTQEGRACGNASAYSRNEGRSPACYKKDISPTMIENYRKIHALDK